jgi:dTDP-glucose pyrophosphorylase
MKPLSMFLPKPLLPIDDKPIIIHHIERLESCGIDEIVITLNQHLGKLIELAITEGHPREAKIRFITQEKRGGLGYAIMLCQEIIGDNSFVVQFGDEINETANFHKAIAGNMFNGLDGAIGIIRPSNEKRIMGTATLRLSPNDEVNDYVEKPRREEIMSTASTSGTYLFSHDFFEALKETRAKPSTYINGEHSIGAAIRVFLRSNKKVVCVQETGQHAHFTSIEDFRNCSTWRRKL